MTEHTAIIKRSGKSENFDIKKLVTSIEAAASSVGLPSGVASDIASKATREITDWLADKTEVTSADLRRVAARTIEKFSAEAGYLYQNQKEVL